MTDDNTAGPPVTVQKSEAERRKELTPEQYRVLRGRGTERAGTSRLLDEHRSGHFQCAACGQPLFDSRTQFESGSGWPSFYEPLPGAVGTEEDRSHFMRRTEVHCSRCGGHSRHWRLCGRPRSQPRKSRRPRGQVSF